MFQYALLYPSDEEISKDIHWKWHSEVASTESSLIVDCATTFAILASLVSWVTHRDQPGPWN
jgi:hypothetical protein